MELYYKDLISKDSSLDKLVDDLMLVVQGTTDLAKASGGALPGESQQELTTRLQRLKDAALRLREGARAGAQAVDRTVRRHPYGAAGLALALGIVAGAPLSRRARGAEKGS